MSEKIEPSSGCVFCDIEVEHSVVVCGRVKPLSPADQEAFMEALKNPPKDLPILRFPEGE